MEVFSLPLCWTQSILVIRYFKQSPRNVNLAVRVHKQYKAWITHECEMYVFYLQYTQFVLLDSHL